MTPPAQHHLVSPSRFLRARLWLASAMWVPVLVANVVAVGLGATLPLADGGTSAAGDLALTAGSAEQILGALAAGMITFTGITFSAVFVAAQIQTSAYSPRLAARLRRDPVVVTSLALPTATATYALVALASIGRQEAREGPDFVPAVTVLLALVLLVVTLGAFVALVQRAFEQTQIGGILRGLVRHGSAVVADVHPVATEATGPLAAPAPVADPDAVTVLHDGAPAVLGAVDRAALLRLAARTGAFVEVLPRVGQHLDHGVPTLRLHHATAPPDRGAAERVLVLARQRTIDQDPGFALRILVDIAIRALSPAINDPTTAVQALDRIEAMLVDLYRRRPGPALVLDREGHPRGRIPAPGWDEYLELAVTEVRQYGADAVQVARRLRALHHRLEAVVDPGDTTARARLALERRLLDDAVAQRFPDPVERAMAAHPDRMGLGGG